jgi:hypothetical protein
VSRLEGVLLTPDHIMPLPAPPLGAQTALACALKSVSLAGRARYGELSRRLSSAGMTKEIAGVKFRVGARPAPGQPFHLAFPVHDLDAARSFWGATLGCVEGRCAPGGALRAKRTVLYALRAAGGHGC